VHDEFIITGSGPGAAFEFALKIVELLTDTSKFQEIAADLLIKM